MALRSLLAPTLLLVVLDASAQTPASTDTVSQLVARLEPAVVNGDRAAFTSLGAGEPISGAEAFWAQMSPPPDRIVIKERDRTALTDGSQRLVLEILTVRNQEGHVGTWTAQLRPVPPTLAAASTGPWRLSRLDEGSTVTGIYRVSLDAARQYAVSNLRIEAPDLELSMTTGSAFLASIPSGATAVVLVGRGTMAFAPFDEAERTQMRLFSGSASLHDSFEIALLRVNPDEFAPFLASGALKPAALSPSVVRRASRYFDDTIGQSLTVDLGDLSRERWSLVPPPGDMLSEVRTRRFGALTYARTSSQSEDVTLFDRERRKNIALYASREKLAMRGRYYSEDEAVDYDIESLDVDVDLDPARPWIEGSATLRLMTREPASSITLRLADSLTVRTLSSDELGRLTFLRVAGQDTVVVKPPTMIPAGQHLTIRIAYGGRMAPQALSPDSPPRPDEEPFLTGSDPALEPRYIYSTGGYWYPQSAVLDYAPAKLRVSVPPGFRVVASGTQVGEPTPAVAPIASGSRVRAAFVFEADKPVPYLACVISRFAVVAQTTIDVSAAGASSQSSGGASGDVALPFTVQANSRQVSQARNVAESAASILRFYVSLLGDVPYPSLTVAVAEREVPGGHGPAYLALVDQPLATSRLVWRSDPVYFPDYPSFFIAHELAHQWWGQAVGGKNYHERWLSEGIAQYFAALYAERERGRETFEGMLRQMQRAAIASSDQGPISLGYRLGHIRNDARVYRAILYNKSAMVLHMLRRLVGDEAFFTGLRHFYREFSFKKAGTDDFQRAMERASAMNLGAFFDQWIFGSRIPRIKVSRVTSATTLTLTFEQNGPVMPVPVTVTVVYGDGSTDSVVVPVVEAKVSRVLPLRAPLRDLKIDDDHAALATFTR
jgi:hypothetical protein